MDREQLINRCKYYKGEEQCPHKGGTDKAMFWLYEQIWVEMSTTPEGKEIIANYVDDYNEAGLYDFEKRDGTPQNLKALLLNRYYHSDGYIPAAPLAFKAWYKEQYIEQSK